MARDTRRPGNDAARDTRRPREGPARDTQRPRDGAAGDARRAGDGASRKPPFDPRRLDVVERDGAFVLLQGGEPVRTPGGRPVAGSRRFVELVRREAEIARGFEPHSMSAFALYVAQKDHLEQGRDPVARDMAKLLREEEPLLDVGEGPDEDARQACWPYATAFLAEIGGVEGLPAAYAATSAAQRAAVALLFGTHHVGVIVPLLLALGRCTASEYAEALLAMHRAHPRIFEPDWKAYTDNFVIAREDATIVQEYLSLAP